MLGLQHAKGSKMMLATSSSTFHHAAQHKGARCRVLPSRRRSPFQPSRCKVTTLNCAQSTSLSGQAHESVDVAILGGGPAGLATAVSLRRACSQLNVKVYERVPVFTPRGAGLGLTVNGLRALQAIDPQLYSDVYDKGCNSSFSLVFPADGADPITVPTSASREKELKEYGVHTRFIGWSDLQEVLADALPADTVQLGHQFERYELEDDGRVTLHFGSGTPPVTASIVIGCDGYRSKLRHQWLNDGPPQFAGTVAWRARVPVEKSPISREYSSFHIQNGRAFAVYPGGPGYMVWAGTAYVAAMEESGVDRVEDRHHQFSTQAIDRSGKMTGAEIKRRAQRIFAQHPEPLRAVIDATDPDMILEHDLCCRPAATFPDNALGQGPLTLAGDAAHVIRPTGQGTNQSLEDAYHLGRLIAEGGPTAHTLRKYEAVRLPTWKLSAYTSTEHAENTYRANASNIVSNDRPRVDVMPLFKQLLDVKFEPLKPSTAATV